MEHRWGQRTDFDVPVWLRPHLGAPDDPLLGARVVNASISGALLHTRIELPLLSLLDVFIVDEAIPACVVRQAGSNIYGVEWRELAPEILSALCLTSTSSWTHPHLTPAPTSRPAVSSRAST